MGISIPIPTRKNMRLIEAAEDIQNNPVEDITYQHTVLCQTSLPYRSTVERTWERRNGKVILFMEAGSALDPVKERYVELPLPFGPKARLILLYLNTMAIKTQSRVIEAENSMTAFIRQLQNGREPNGDEVRKFQQQLRSLAKARINLGVLGDERSFDGKLDVVDNFDIWFPKNPNQRVLWTNTVELSQKYFETLINHAVPLDPRAIAALSHSSMALDIYSWLAQRLHRIPGNNSALVAWTTLQQQLGDNYKEIRMFRRTFLKTLKDVLTQYPEARLDTNERGLLLKNSPPPVRKKLVQISGL
jgi:hypothetical protein